MRRQLCRAARERQAAEIEARRLEAAAQAEQDIAAADVAVDHPYLVAKQVGAHGVLLDGDKLLIPIVDGSGQVISHQTIGPDGEKRFLAGGRKKGGFFMLGRPSGVVT